MNTLPLITAAILSALTANLGTFDLSGADRVQEGSFDKPPTVPFAGVTPPELTGSEPQGVGPDWYLETYTTEIRAWGAVTTGTTETRAARGRRLASEIQQALDVQRHTIGTAIWRCVFWRVSETEPNPAGATALPGHATVALTVEFTFRRASGAGV